jgi:hypothetical protein
MDGEMQTKFIFVVRRTNGNEGKGIPADLPELTQHPLPVGYNSGRTTNVQSAGDWLGHVSSSVKRGDSVVLEAINVKILDIPTKKSKSHAMANYVLSKSKRRSS